jgi:AraC-like DNA-binding protein
MVCVKDVEGRYVGVNHAFVRRARRRRTDEVIGRRAAQLFPADLAASYEAQDRALLMTGESIRNHLELIADAGDPRGGRWYVTTKVLSSTDANGTVVVATSLDAHLGNRAENATGLRAAIELAHDHCHEPLRVTDLAGAAGMSTDRLERAMRTTLAISPKQYIVRLRAERVATLLVTTARSIADIAAECGYYDQSQLTRQFRRVIGVTPASYRSEGRPGAVTNPDRSTD